MNVSEIKAGQGKIDVEVEVVSMEPEKQFDKYGKVLRMVNSIVKDDSGEIKMTFWNDDIARVAVGKKLKISNGYASEYKGELSLTAGKFGKFEVLN